MTRESVLALIPIVGGVVSALLGSEDKRREAIEKLITNGINQIERWAQRVEECAEQFDNNQETLFLNATKKMKNALGGLIEGDLSTMTADIRTVQSLLSK